MKKQCIIIFYGQNDLKKSAKFTILADNILDTMAEQTNFQKIFQKCHIYTWALFHFAVSNMLYAETLPWIMNSFCKHPLDTRNITW